GSPQLIDVILPGSSGAARIRLATGGLGESMQGTRQLQVVVDPNNFIAESDENDTRATAALTIAPSPAPNLKVLTGNLKFDPPAPEQGDIVTVTVTILNDGNADAQDVVVQFTDISGGNFLPIGTEQTIDTIPAGSSAVLQVFYTTTEDPGERE
ncbi:MAG TPA: CARDB domain-containing protein, partial [Caldilineaceae bacterium]|nr:CARDB domain-containing protein [Caldilineaceae bacterium]